MTDADEARYLARVGNLVDTFRQIAIGLTHHCDIVETVECSARTAGLSTSWQVGRSVALLRAERRASVR
jgi:hypothetical protein